MAIAQQLVGNSPTTVYTSTGNTATTVVFFMNDNVAARTLDVYVVPNGGSATTNTQIIKSLTIDAGETYTLNTEKLVLEDGDTIQATASATSSIYATVSYVSI